MKAILKKILPESAYDFAGCANSFIDAIDDIAAVGRNLGFEAVDAGIIYALF